MASERETAQTGSYVQACTRCTAGVVGWILVGVQTRRGVTNPYCSRIVLERLATEGESPVGETVADSCESIPKYCGTREIL